MTALQLPLIEPKASALCDLCRQPTERRLPYVRWLVCPDCIERAKARKQT